jgi:hypothetical protein
MLAAGLVVGEIIVADIIGEGFYEIHSFGETYVNVKLLKLFGKGWLWRGHITNCHNYPEPINLERWMSYRRVSRRPPRPDHGNNCHGHFTSIAAGGNGHSVNDGCGF